MRVVRRPGAARPIGRSLQTLTGDPSIVGAGYQVFGILLQCSWVAAVFALLRCIGLTSRRVALVVLALIPSYFFFIQSIFVWPKLLAGSLAVGSFCLLLCRDRTTALPVSHAGSAAALAVLAFLCHGGVATALLRLEPLVEGALRGVNTNELTVSIDDVSNPSAPEQLYPLGAAPEGMSVWSHEIKFKGGDWRVSLWSIGPGSAVAFQIFFIGALLSAGGAAGLVSLGSIRQLRFRTMTRRSM